MLTRLAVHWARRLAREVPMVPAVLDVLPAQEVPPVRAARPEAVQVKVRVRVRQPGWVEQQAPARWA